MTFNEKHEHWQSGLDDAHDKVLDFREAALLLTEEIEDELLHDKVLFATWANRFALESLNNPLLLGFIDWAVDRIKRERISKG